MKLVSMNQRPDVRTSLPMDQNSTVKAAGSEDSAELGMSPGDFPHGSFVALQRRTVVVCVSYDIKDLDCTIWWTIIGEGICVER